MRNLIRLIIKHHFILLFVILEVIALILLFQNNEYNKVGYLNLMQRLDASIHQKIFKIKKYTHLIEENERLVDENLRLRSQILDMEYVIIPQSAYLMDTNITNRFDFIPAKVINNSTNKQYNYITLNKGENEGIEPEMAVISPDGVVGKVIRVSLNFSVVISLLNRDFMVSSKIKNSNYFGPVSWEGNNYRIAYLKEIPFHVKPIIGDTIVTSGFSKSFPENIMVGFIKDYELEGGNYHKIEVELVTDFKRLTNVYVVKNKFKDEQEKLEKD